MVTKRELILLVSTGVLFYTVQFLIVKPSTTSITTKNKNHLELYTTISTNDKRKKNSCVSLSSDNNHDEKEASEISLESLLQNDDGILHQVFITMPAKAAGTSLKEFTRKCMKQNGSDFQEKNDNFVSGATQVKRNFFYDEFLHKNTIITSHLYSDTPLQKLIQSMPYSTKKKRSSRGSLLIYVHRDETDRLVSAIRFLISERVCGTLRGTTQKKFNEQNMQLNETHCILKEDDVVNTILEKPQEIDFSANKLLTCNTYKILKENNPLSYFDYDDNYDEKRTRRGGVLFMDYSQVDKLQKILEKYHCPGMLSSMESNGSGSDAAIHANTAESRDVQILLKRRDKKGDLVNLNDWLDQKRMSFEWSLNLKGSPETSEASCQSTTKRIEENLYQCPDETMILPNSLL